MKPSSVCKPLWALCLLASAALPSVAVAQDDGPVSFGQGGGQTSFVRGDLDHASRQELAQRIFGDMALDMDDVVPLGGPGSSYEMGMVFYTKPHLYQTLCEAQAFKVELGPVTRPPDKSKAVLKRFGQKAYYVYYVPDQAPVGCQGHAGAHLLFSAPSAPVAETAVSLLQAVIDAARSDKPLSFPVWNHCSSPYKQCKSEGLRAQLARLKIVDLRRASDIHWIDADGNRVTAFALEVGSGKDGHWQMQVDESELIAPVPTHKFEIHGVHMNWVDSRPMP